MSNISVVIPVLNESKKIEACLEAVFAQSLKPYEIIVVDGMSNDDTVAKARKFPVIVVKNENVIRSNACQIGIETALGDYVAFTDGDCIPDKDWLANLFKEFPDVYGEFGLGVIGVGGKFQDIGDSLWMKSINSTFQTPFSGARSRWDTRKEMKVLSVSGGNGMVLKSAALKVGGFNIKLRGCEDLEFASRLGKTGRLIYTPDAIVLHNHQRGLWGFVKRAYQYGKDRREAKIWDAQSTVALFAPFLLLFLLTSWIVVPTIVGAYLLIAMAIGVLTAKQYKELIFALTVPVAFVGQHVAFIFGFWREFIDRK